MGKRTSRGASPREKKACLGRTSKVKGARDEVGEDAREGTIGEAKEEEKVNVQHLFRILVYQRAHRTSRRKKGEGGGRGEERRGKESHPNT